MLKLLKDTLRCITKRILEAAGNQSEYLKATSCAGLKSSPDDFEIHFDQLNLISQTGINAKINFLSNADHLYGVHSQTRRRPSSMIAEYEDLIFQNHFKLSVSSRTRSSPAQPQVDEALRRSL